MKKNEVLMSQMKTADHMLIIRYSAVLQLEQKLKFCYNVNDLKAPSSVINM
jgi:hypothetical protein